VGRSPDHALRQLLSASMGTMEVPGFVLMRKIADGQENLVDIEVLEVCSIVCSRLLGPLYPTNMCCDALGVEEGGCGPCVHMCVHASMDVYVVRFGCEPVFQQKTCKAGLIHLFRCTHTWISC